MTKIASSPSEASRPAAAGPLPCASAGPAYLVPPRTPVDVWAPAFHWLPLDKFTVETLLYLAADGYFCKLCQAVIRYGVRSSHVAAHVGEAKDYRTARAREAQRVAAERLRGINRARKRESNGRIA